ncbi:MAG TPA: ABC transporter permease subunit [Candidatus Sumerlaeota bacterium]|nr:ABC transporter permease subunit [Candidatus Sumerlaeota bacterium]
MWWKIYKREVGAYFQGPTLYVLAGIFLFLMGWFTIGMLAEFAEAYDNLSLQQTYDMKNLNITEWVVRGFFSLLNFLMMFMIPLFSMRLFAEESRNRTLEALLTCPVREGSVLAGKFLASLTILYALCGLCMIYPVLFEIYSEPEWPVIWTGWLGIALAVPAYLAFGVFASTITENQIIAAFVGFTGLLFFYLVGDVTSSVEGFSGRLAEGLSINAHSAGFTQGLIESADLFYFAVFTFFFLFLSREILALRRWRT